MPLNWNGLQPISQEYCKLFFKALAQLFYLPLAKQEAIELFQELN
jgi:hypothetical protein